MVLVQVEPLRTAAPSGARFVLVTATLPEAVYQALRPLFPGLVPVLGPGAPTLAAAHARRARPAHSVLEVMGVPAVRKVCRQPMPGLNPDCKSGLEAGSCKSCGDSGLSGFSNAIASIWNSIAWALGSDPGLHFCYNPKTLNLGAQGCTAPRRA